MEVTQRKVKASFKQLDGVLRTLDPDTGERVSLSHKCGELDRQIPSLLGRCYRSVKSHWEISHAVAFRCFLIIPGVSKAILEHVVFCHQEESSWPLQESAALKKRFDDIFDSTKYSKALKAFRDTEKEYIGKAKDLQQDVVRFTSHRHAARGYRQELEAQNEKVDVLSEHQKDLTSRVEKLDEQIAEAQKLLDKMEEANGVIDAKRNELEQEERVIDEKRRLVEKDVTSRGVEALQTERRDFDQNRQAEVDRMKQLQERARALEGRIEKLREEEQALSTSHGKLQAEKEAHDKKLRERYTMMERMTRNHKLDLTQAALSQTNTSIVASLSQSMTIDDDLTVLTVSADDMEAFFERLDSKEQELTSDVDEHKKSAREQEQKLQSVINELSSKIQTEKNGTKFSFLPLSGTFTLTTFPQPRSSSSPKEKRQIKQFVK